MRAKAYVHLVLLLVMSEVAISQSVQILTLPQRFRDSTTASYREMEYLKYKDTIKAHLTRTISGDQFSIFLTVRGLRHETTSDTNIVAGLKAMNKSNDTAMAFIGAYADGKIQAKIRGENPAVVIDSGQSQVLNTLLVGPGTSIVLPPLNFGVTSIVAGYGITIDPVDGLGEVTITADTATLSGIWLRKSDSTLYVTKILWADSLSKLVRLRDTNSVFYSYARTRDSLAAHRSVMLVKADSGVVWTSYPAFRDSLAKYLQKRDSSAGYATFPRFRDSLATARSRYVWKPDSGVVYFSFPAGRDSLANARSRYVWKADSGVVYASYPAFRDSLAKRLQIRDSSAGYTTFPRFRDSLATARSRYVWKADSGVTYASYPAFRDSIAKLIKIRDSSGTTATYVTWPRMRDSLAARLQVRDSSAGYTTFPRFRDSLANARARYVWKADSGVTYASYAAFRDSIAKTIKWRDTVSNGLMSSRYEVNRYRRDKIAHGFADSSTTGLTFDEGTYTLTLAPTGSAWTYWRSGVPYTITGSKTSTISGSPPDSGAYYFYIDATDGTITNSLSAWTLLDAKVPVARIDWNNNLFPKHILIDERHTVAMDWATHYFIHATIGSRLASSVTLSGYTVSSANDTSTRFGITATSIVDQDRVFTVPEFTKPTGASGGGYYGTIYRVASTIWKWDTTNVPFRHTASGYIQYDNAGTMTQGASAKFYNTYLFVSNARGIYRFGIIPGRAEFATAAAAYAENYNTFTFTNAPVEEFVMVYQFTWETNASYTNKGKCRLNRAPQPINATAVSVAGSGGSTDHNSLSGLQGGTTAEYYHLTSAQNTNVGALNSMAYSDSTWWWNKRDTIPSSPGVPTINRMLDSLDDARTRNVVKADSGVTYFSWPSGRDSLANARARYVWKADSGVTYASYPAFRDSLAKYMQRRDSTTGYPTVNRMLDSLSDIRTSMNSIGGSSTADTTGYLGYNPKTTYAFFDDLDGQWVTHDGGTTITSGRWIWIGSTGGNYTTTTYNDSSFYKLTDVYSNWNGYTDYPSAMHEGGMWIPDKRDWTLEFRARGDSATSSGSDTSACGFAFGIIGNTDMSQWAGSQQQTGIYFWKQGNQSWTAVTKAAGTTTTSCSLTDIKTWKTMKISKESGGIKFYINGTLKATHTTNIPAPGSYSLAIGFVVMANPNIPEGETATPNGHIDWVRFYVGAKRPQ